MAILGLAMNHGLSFSPFMKRTAAEIAYNAEPVLSSNELYISRNIISINTLPVELLTTIFELCLPNGLSSDPDVPTLVHIISVCKHWRAVALMAPHLWARLMLWDPRKRHRKMVEQWLSRSHSCPLTLAIHHSSRDFLSRDEVAETTYQILIALLSHLYRWKSITLRLERFPTFPALPLNSAAAPLLERVEVCNGSACFEPQTAAQFWRRIFSYPSVRRVSWICGSRPSSLTNWNCMGWERLTHLRSRFVVDAVFFETLACCRSLEVFHVEDIDIPVSPLIPRDVVTIPSLHSFIVRSRNPLMATVLSQLSLPSLRKAELCLSGAGLKSWVDLLNRSGCFIVDLTLHAGGFIPEADVAALLSTTSLMYLDSLTASFSENTNFLVQRLACLSDLPFPALRHLDLRLEAERCVGGTIAEMVQARMQSHGSALRHVVINHYPTGSELAELSVDAQLLKEMRIGGLNVEYYGD